MMICSCFFVDPKSIARLIDAFVDGLLDLVKYGVKEVSKEGHCMI